MIGRAFKELGLVEQWGSGIRRMVAACTAAGLPAPDFTEIAAHIGLTPRTTQNRLAKLADRSLVVAVGSGPRNPRRKWFASRPTNTD